MYRILIVEDDETIASLIAKRLSDWGYEVLIETRLREPLGSVSCFDPHLILMDVMLPYYNGFFRCAEIRKISKAPMIFISSASDNMNIVMAMNMGGDDFISKPFDMDVLVAKLGALIRRSYSFRESMSVIEVNGVRLNMGDATVEHEGHRAELTKNDFRILSLLMENPGSTVSRETIIKALWEDESFIDDNTLTVNITRLRKKLGEIGLEEFIRTKKGIGYMV